MTAKTLKAETCQFFKWFQRYADRKMSQGLSGTESLSLFHFLA